LVKKRTSEERKLMSQELPLRITLLDPPRGVTFCLQKGKDGLVPPTVELEDQLSFDFKVSVDDERRNGLPIFRGAFVQGPLGGRFIYVNSGTYAGQADSRWGRRAKVPLGEITLQQVNQVLADPNAILHAKLAGTGKDGGPLCATVPLLNDGWQVDIGNTATETKPAAKKPASKKGETHK
jgi:hypothetical protein